MFRQMFKDTVLCFWFPYKQLSKQRLDTQIATLSQNSLHAYYGTMQLIGTVNGTSLIPPTDNYLADTPQKKSFTF